MVKIAIITPLLQHYRLSFYEKLSTIKNDYQLTVFYSINESEDGKAGFTGKTSFFKKGFKDIKLKIHPFILVYTRGMYSEIRKTEPDIVIFLANTGNISYWRILIWARQREKKIIIWTSGWDPGRAKGSMLFLKNLMVSAFFRKADFFLTYSSSASRYVESLGIDKSKIEICYNGIETDILIKNSPLIIRKSKELIKKYDLENFLTFLYVGGLIPEKKVDLLMDAFVELHKKYDKIKLILIGDGPLKSLIEEKLNDWNDPNILYLGRILEGIDPFFAASDCLILPGAGGLALNQGMFWKKTCIVSKADGTEDDLIIENVTGYRFIPENIESLISAMERRLNDHHAKVDFMSENAHKIIMDRSNVNNMVGVFSKTIDNLLSGGQYI
jgi:glycosyltransferase involved in cell wall biosynthesis